MQIKHLIYAVSFFLVFACTARAEQNSIAVAYPPDRTVNEFGVLAVSLKVVKDSVDVIRVWVNGREAKTIAPDSETECFSVPLTVGMNTVQITATKKGMTTGEAPFSVFRRSDLESLYQKPPSDFKRDFFHMKEHAECTGCHTLTPGEADRRPVSIPGFTAGSLNDKSAAQGSTCYSCHRATVSFPYVHGPASVWSCLSCHDPLSVPVYSVKKPDTKVCFGCHTEQKNDWGDRTYIHGPVNTGNCAICHSPHGSENPFNLFKPTWDLCVSCHADKATGRHILVGYIYEGHPTHNRPDPLREGKELTCASCHNPHASDYPRLWALNVNSQIELCLKCHKY